MKIRLVLFLYIILSTVSYAQGSDKNIPDLDKYLKVGNTSFKEQKYSEAIENFTKALNINSKDEKTLYKRAVCYFILKDENSAIADFTAVIAITENNSSAYYFRGLSKFNAASKKENPDVEQTQSGCDDISTAKQLGYQTDYENLKLVCPNL